MISQLAVRPARAAEISETSRSTIYAEMAAGRLPYLQIGRSRRILITDLEDWLRRHRVAPAAPDTDHPGR